MQRYDRSRRLLALAIAALAGWVDASGFLAADRYFLSFMSGNTTRLAVDLAQDPQQALVPLGLIAGFLAGVVAGALLADALPARRKTAVLSLCALLLIASAAAASTGHVVLMGAAAVLAMGAVNNSYRRDGEVAVGLTYMTGAVVRFGQGLASWLQGAPRPGWLVNGALWLAMALGAAAGAMTFLAEASLTPWIGAVGATALAIMAWRIERQAS